MQNGIVHGGIRHLENHAEIALFWLAVHGGIRHLENGNLNLNISAVVHGGIRHLETTAHRW